jgi:triacylglycerol esterase/lipase EstA (alpha/beta hydrolase family)
VIFVHGFNGDWTTWRNGSVEWPKLLADDPEIGSDIDVYRLDYFSTLAEGQSVPKLSTIIGQQLDQKFFGDRADAHPQTAYRKIVMVCHSLGGILCRNYLLHVKLRWGHQFLSLIGATITLGTPLRGADLANFVVLRLSSQNEQLRVLRPEDVNDFLQIAKQFYRGVRREAELSELSSHYLGRRI